MKIKGIQSDLVEVESRIGYDLTDFEGECLRINIEEIDDSYFSVYLLDKVNYERALLGESFIYDATDSCKYTQICKTNYRVTTENSYIVIENDNVIGNAILYIDDSIVPCSNGTEFDLWFIILASIVVGAIALVCIIVFLIGIIVGIKKIYRDMRHNDSLMVEMRECA
jgi:hypothetical protein